MRRLDSICLAALVNLTLGCDSPSSTSAGDPSADPSGQAQAPNEGGDAAPEPTHPAGAAKSSGEQAPKKEQVRAAEDPERAAELQAKLRERLRQGRDLVQAKKYEAGMAAFERALAIEPNDPRLLSEIGWAAFLAGDLERAEQANRDSVRFATDPNIQGASLYNLGRVAEARDQPNVAARYYMRSLAVRANDTVTARLEKLTDQGADPEAVQHEGVQLTECAFVSVPGDTPLEVCQAIAAGASGEEASCDASAFDTKTGRIERLEIDDETLTQAALFSYQARFTDYWVAALEVDGQWHATPLFWVYNPGAFGIFEDLEGLDMRARQLVPGGAPELVITYTHTRHDTDMGIDEAEDTATTMMNVIGLDRGEPARLLGVITDYTYERDRLGATDPEDIPEDLRTEGLPLEQRRGVTVDFDDQGNVELSKRDDIPTSASPGTFPLGTSALRCAASR